MWLAAPEQGGRQSGSEYEAKAAQWLAQLAVQELLVGLEEEHPDLAADAFFGAAGLMVVEADLTEHILGAWHGGLTSLRRPLEGGSLLDVDTALAATA